MRNANEAESCLYLRAIRARDEAYLVWLVAKRFPNVAWGAVTSLLPDMDVRWALDAMVRPLRNRITLNTETPSL
jgi:uncharacterized protein (DUF3820 family)